MIEARFGVRVPLAETGTDPARAAIEAEIRSERGGEIDLLYRALLNSPAIASGWERMLTAVRNRTDVPADLRELIILRVAVLNRAAYEFAVHAPLARAAGVPDAKIDALTRFPEAEDQFTDDEKLVLTLTDRMTVDIEVPDALMDRLGARFGPQGIVEVVATVAAYNMVSRFLVAVNITP
jgi:4-carboxymuconolactone decarboxylase